MVNLAALKAEINGDPAGMGYAGKTDEQITAILNAETRSRNRTSMTGSEIINAVVPSEYSALGDPAKELLWNVVHLGTVDPFGVEADLLIDVFGSGSATIVALAQARVEAVSRATELGFGRVRAGDVQSARRI